MKYLSISKLIILALVLAVLAGFFLSLSANNERERLLGITNFEECAVAGYPVMESYPEQCRTPDGRLFVREIGLLPKPPQPTDCVIGGCSMQLCGERSEMEELVTTCEYRAEYACYNRFSACERQTNGACGWTETPGFRACLANPPHLDEGTEPQAI